MYGLENRYLNWPAETAWYNLGHWSRDDDRYPQACERLARTLAVEADFRPGQRLFDIGCGCAEQDIFWSQAFGLNHVEAITLPGPQLAWALRRIDAAEVGHRVRVTGVALEDDRSQGIYDHVAALDAAYHFSKSTLFRRAGDLTAAGGRLSFTDLVLTQAPLDPWTQRMLRGARINPSHLLNQDDLDTAAAQAGFVRTSVRDLSQEVMLGFSRFVRRSRGRLVRAAGLRALPFLVTGWALSRLYRQGSLTYRLMVYTRQ